MKPGIAQATKGSSRNRHEITQISKVLDVSMVDLYAADAYLVVAIPKQLKNVIEKQLSITSIIRIGLFCIYQNAKDEFSR
jgi:hypothetical protein